MSLKLSLYRHEYYLERTDTHSGKIDSGTKLTFDCSQAGKVLVSDTNCTEDCVTGYDIECFNGEFIHSEFPPVGKIIEMPLKNSISASD